MTGRNSGRAAQGPPQPAHDIYMWSRAADRRFPREGGGYSGILHVDGGQTAGR